ACPSRRTANHVRVEAGQPRRLRLARACRASARRGRRAPGHGQPQRGHRRPDETRQLPDEKAPVCVVLQQRQRHSELGELAFQWDILNYGRLLNNVRLQDAKTQELVGVYQQKVLTAAQEVENGIISFLSAQREARSLATSVKDAALTLRLASAN